MAGLLIKELMVRGDLRRCLIVAPGNLVGQWQDELWQKLGPEIDIMQRETRRDLPQRLKTKSSRQQVLIPRIAAEALTAHQARQAAERAHAGTAWEDHDLVFTNTLGRPLHPTNFLLRDFSHSSSVQVAQDAVPRPSPQHRNAAA